MSCQLTTHSKLSYADNREILRTMTRPPIGSGIYTLLWGGDGSDAISSNSRARLCVRRGKIAGSKSHHWRMEEEKKL